MLELKVQYHISLAESRSVGGVYSSCVANSIAVLLSFCCQDRERRASELNELRHLLEDNHSAVTKWKRAIAEEAEWSKYMRCDGKPDPAVQQEVNTYITLWRDDPEVNITSVLRKCELALELVEELEALLRDATNPQEVQKYQEVLIDLQELIHFKHHLATGEVLERASSNIDTETGNMQTVIRDDNVTMCLWANLRKNPRFKGFHFEEVGLGFELPKQLAVKDIAIRILHTRYDHLSLLAMMTHLRIHTPSCRSLVGAEEVLADVDADELKQQEETKEDEDRKGEGENEIQQQSLHEESVASLQSSRSSVQSTAEQQGSQVQTQIEVMSEQLSTMDLGIQAVDLRQFTPLGGVFYYDVYHLPPQAHQVNGWEIRQLSDSGLKTFPYTSEKSNPEDQHHVAVSITLPDSVIFLEPPQVARWDAAGKLWRMDGITDVSYEEAEGMISFKMDSFQAFTLMQETYANLPFQSWELRPLGQDSALYTVSGSLVDVSITIQGNQCMLQLEQERGLTHLTGRWMSSPALLRAMLHAGINIFVNEHTEKYVKVKGSYCAKDPLTEHAAYEQMALFASACAFSWSKWNSRCDAKHLVLQVCEHSGPDPVPKDSWSLYLLGAQRSQKLGIRETTEAFCTDLYPGSEIHSTFIHMLQDDMSPDGIARTRGSSYQFVDTVQSLLCATRPFMYS
ncbi:uncharacterized protein V6R79_025724 [Siganus canaliculatus]